MNITLEDIKQEYKFHNFYLYHIKGKKWGCTLELEKRLNAQGYTIEDTEEVKEVIGVEVADRLEKFLNEKEGYPYNHTQSYLLNLFRRVKNARTYKNHNRGKIFKRQGGYKLSNRHKKKITIGLKKAYKEGRRNERDTSFFKTKEYKEKCRQNSLEQWKNPKRMASVVRGVDKPNAIFTEEDVRFIRKHYYRIINQYQKIPEGMYSIKQLMDKYNCSKYAILNIVNGKSYKSIK